LPIIIHVIILISFDAKQVLQLILTSSVEQRR